MQVKEKKTSAVGPVLLGFFLFVVVGSGEALDGSELYASLTEYAAKSVVAPAALLQIIRTATSGSMF